MVRAIALILALVVATAPKLEFVSNDAEAHYDRAEAAFARGDYEAASAELHAAYELEPIPRLLYARAQAERLAEHWSLAAELYARFLDGNPPAEGREIAEQHALYVEAQLQRNRGECDAADASFLRYVEQYPDSEEAPLAKAAIGDCQRPAPPVPIETDAPPSPRVASSDPAPIVDDSQPPPTPRIDAPPRRRWYADPAGGALFGSGIVGLGAGATLLVNARRLVDVADQEGQHSTANDRLATARRHQTFGIAALGLGAALLTGAIVRYILVARKDRSTASRFGHQLGQRRP